RVLQALPRADVRVGRCPDPRCRRRRAGDPARARRRAAAQRRGGAPLRALPWTHSRRCLVPHRPRSERRRRRRPRRGGLLRAAVRAHREARAVTSVIVFVEVPAGSRNKYEYDAATGTVMLDRRLFVSMTYPADYGFVEGTL